MRCIFERYMKNVMSRRLVQTKGGNKTQIRRSDGQVELVDEMGNRLGVGRRPPRTKKFGLPNHDGKSGPKVSFDELIARVESL